MSKTITYYNIKLGNIVVLYIWITYLIYIISPMQPVDKGLDETYSIIFLIAVSIAVLLGVRTVSIPKIKQPFVFRVPSLFNQSKLSILQSIIIVITIGYLLDLFARGLGGFTLAFGENYEKMVSLKSNDMISLWGQIYAMISPFRYIILSYGILNYNKLSKLNKWLYLGVIMSSLCYSVFGLGTQKGVGDIVIIIIITIIIKSVRSNTIKKAQKKIFLFALLFIAFFSYMQASRDEAFGRTSISSNGYYKYDGNNILCQVVGDKIGEGLIKFGFYVSNGYTGLNYCLQLPFEWTYGYGGSKAGNNYFHRYLGAESRFEETYPIRMEREIGWPGLMFWPSAYAWWASDLTWYGVILLMFFYAKFMCVLFKESYYYRNPLSIALFAYLSIGLIYLPANNQLMQSTANFISTISLLIVWFFCHKRFNHA